MHMLQALNTDTPLTESRRLSNDIYHKTAALAKEFSLTSPPSYHNFLVNVGLKEKGLCYHWSDALYLHFKTQKYTYFEFHLMGANISSYWMEHNVLVVTSKGMSPYEGIVVDPWRNSGALYFSKVVDDKAYIWKHRPNREYK